MNWEKKLKEMNVLALGFFLFIEGKSVVFFVIHFLKRFSNFFYGVQSFLVFLSAVDMHKHMKLNSVSN